MDLSNSTKLVPEPVPPVHVAVVGGTGDGSVTQIPVETPGNAPNLVLTVVTPLVAIFIRFANNYLTILVGLITAGMTNDNVIPAATFGALVWKCAGLSIAGAAIGLIKDLVTVFGRLESKYPLLTGNV